MKANPKVDAYILKAEEFAQPLLNHLRAVVHVACPDVEEAIKWSFPHFIYHGKNMCYMASFSKHFAFGFWRSDKIEDPFGLLLRGDARASMGNFGKINHISQLPTEEQLTHYIVQAAMLIEAEKDMPEVKKPKKLPKPLMEMPTELAQALDADKKAQLYFEKLSTSHKNEYMQWIAEAKQEATRQKRALTAAEWLAQGKSRNWKYER